MRPVSLSRVALAIGAACLIAASLLPGTVRFPWLVSFSLICSMLGVGLAWVGRGPARLASLHDPRSRAITENH